jgi:hypothetical protein
MIKPTGLLSTVVAGHGNEQSRRSSYQLCTSTNRSTSALFRTRPQKGASSPFLAAFVALCGITRSRAPIGLCPQQIAKHLDKQNASRVVGALQVVGEKGEPHFVLGISEGDLPAKPIVSEGCVGEEGTSF